MKFSRMCSDLSCDDTIEPLDACSSNALIINDEHLVQICKKSEKSGEPAAALLGRLLILPKLYHLPSKLSTPAVEALLEFLQWHTAVMVTHVLVPVLQYCPETGEQHRDVVAHLVSECSYGYVTQMLSAIAMRVSIRDDDVQIFQLLCDHADQQSTATHKAALAFLKKTADKYKTYVKFGQCLLFVVKKMGQYIEDHESLQLIVNNHSSSLKKAIEVQMKKAKKSR
ncbi:hypothetical protein Hamer_G010241 [Homarus americanus]|uniref:Fanconi Anaemia group E protein C-terminal domain-containing protein n=1 Tax=Homarus americanus TaxID=6706 RepID=A0A8J5K0H5_HOMAM|nr:hypothetical protein Hamer_G010241 [Homarus americanus]